MPRTGQHKEGFTAEEKSGNMQEPANSKQSALIRSTEHISW